jgi:lysophospholipase L1-like esterase
MKTTIITTLLALLAAPVFAGNDKNFTYLALGDSVPFGLNPLLLPPYSTVLPTPQDFIGYPEIVAAAEHLSESKKEVNASCPGETSASFLDTNVVDNGCNSPHLQPSGPIPAFKTGIGLHTAYTVAQMDFAESQFETNKHINLVTLNIGANDVLLVLPQLISCGADITCAQIVLAPVLQSYGNNLGQILSRIRAHYQGTLILMTYYSPSPALDGLTVAVNTVMTQVATQLALQPNFAAVEFADAFTAFQLASADFNHDACQAGLVIPLPPSPPAPPCDIHPTPLGRDLLAATVESANRDKHDESDHKDESGHR